MVGLSFVGTWQGHDVVIRPAQAGVCCAPNQREYQHRL